MKKVLLLIFFAACVEAQGQTSVYHPFPDSNAVWNVYSWACCWGGCPPPPTGNPIIGEESYSYFIQGDTLINGNSYHKIYQSGTGHIYCAYGNSINNYYSWNDTYRGGIRQDTVGKKIYYINGFQECLLYDFSLSVGDTFYDCLSYNPILTSIDSILIGTNYRKRFNFPLPAYSVIEGIGSMSGLLEPIFPGVESYSDLICFSQNGQTLYPDTTSLCQIITSTDNHLAQEITFSIFPNPATNQLTISIPIHREQFAIKEIEIYDVLGEKVFKSQILNPDSQISVDVSSLAPGIYFVRVRTEKGSVAKKLIKQ
ncbi:MAG TPA: T9SS type A sorting domain-containing protein [Bacteroidia bacterium]|nr:T9SS type A sorting domain-containing protein [Bacteroidia bacterium]